MVIAEAPELDTGLVVAIILIALGSLLVIAIVTGLAGVAIGMVIARRSQPRATREALRRGKRVWVGVVGVGATIVSWILLLSVGAAISDDSWGLLLVYLGGLPLPIAWGWWIGRTPDEPPR